MIGLIAVIFAWGFSKRISPVAEDLAPGSSDPNHLADPSNSVGESNGSTGIPASREDAPPLAIATAEGEADTKSS
jgi:hypothetical protein